jgi:DNA processing protein
MAALSDALLVVEAEEKSGTLITARLALELGRDIGAIPGEIFSPNASGTNMLIHEGAYCIATVPDLFSLLHLSCKQESNNKETPKEFIGNEKIIMDMLREPTNKDALLEKTGLSFGDFLTAFSSLEINGYVEESFGEVRRMV